MNQSALAQRQDFCPFDWSVQAGIAFISSHKLFSRLVAGQNLLAFMSLGLNRQYREGHLCFQHRESAVMLENLCQKSDKYMHRVVFGAPVGTV